MSEIDRRLEDLFAADARARRVGRLTIQAPRRSWLPVALAAAGAVVLAAALALPSILERGGVAGPELVPPGTDASPTPTPTPCQDTSVVIPSIAGTKSGRFMGTSLDRVTVRSGATEWHVRFFIGLGATGDPGPATIALDATLQGPEGTIPVRAYAAGPPDGPFTDLTGPLTVQPCRPVVLRVTTASIDDGAYTLRLASVRRPEGDVVTETYSMRLVCEAGPSGDVECRNPAGTGSFAPVPTSPGGTSAPAQSGSARIEGRTAYPAGFRPPLTVYAIDVGDPTRFHSVDVPGSSGDPAVPGTYALEVRPGTYHVVAYLTERSDRPSNPGIYSQYVLCGLTVRCSDHSLVPVTVAAGEARTGIDPSDWYYPDGTTYPPRPD